MKKTVSQQLKEVDSVYIVATKDGDTVIRISGHLPDPDRLRTVAEETKKMLKTSVFKPLEYIGL